MKAQQQQQQQQHVTVVQVPNLAVRGLGRSILYNASEKGGGGIIEVHFYMPAIW